MTFLEKTLTENPSFCILPFLAMCIDARGWHKPCCFYSDYHSDPNAENISLTELLSSDIYKELRQQFLDGEKPEGCKRCWVNEEMGVKSFRQDVNDSFHGHFQESLVNEPLVRIIDYGFGNTCNAACLSCYSGNSSKWAEVDDELADHKYNYFQRTYRPVTKMAFPKWTDHEFSSLREVALSQGEAMLNLGFEKAIAKMVESGSSQKITISVLSNASYFPKPQIIDKLKKFEKVRIELSIDGIDDRFEYLRYPLKMDKLESTVKKWVETCAENPNFLLETHCTVSLLNLPYVQEVREWWRHMITDRVPESVTFGYCWDPIYLSPNLAPVALRERVKEVTGEAYVRNLMENEASSDPRVAETGLEFQLKRFYDFISVMDKKRSLDARKTFPETFKYLERVLS